MPWAINLKSLTAVVATGAGTDIDTLGGRPISMVTIASGVTTGGTVKLQGSPDGSNWVDLASRSVSANGTTADSVDYPMRLVRANLTTRTDGTYTVFITIPAAAPGWRE